MHQINLADIDLQLELARRRKIFDAIFDFALDKTWEFEEKDIMQSCVADFMNPEGRKPTGDKEFVIRVKAKSKG